MAIREMALAALKAKGVRFPDRQTVRITRTRLRDAFAKLEARGIAQTVGIGNASVGRWCRERGGDGRGATWGTSPCQLLVRGTLNQSRDGRLMRLIVIAC
jgi:hypothetical protein